MAGAYRGAEPAVGRSDPDPDDDVDQDADQREQRQGHQAGAEKGQRQAHQLTPLPAARATSCTPARRA